MKLHALWTAVAVLALAAIPAAAAEVGGYLYGTVETVSGTSYTGELRWGTEEAFWDDLFNASKLDEPATGRLPRDYRQRSRKVSAFGLELSGPWNDSWSQRQLIVRFGDLAEIRPHGDDGAEITLRNGRTMRIEGGSNDVGGTVWVWDASVGKIGVDWVRIRSIRFAATPAALHPVGERLRATVKTTEGSFSGFLQWDSEECLTVDTLDGDTEDGRVSIPLGKIKSIARESRHASRVELADGRVLELSGTNDVDSSIRGILVEDPRFGRVEIPWEAFERADLEVAADSGRGYGDYPALGDIRARVTSVAGKSREGKIAFDLDETQLWEMLDGAQGDIEYHIPFLRVKSIQPLSRLRTRVELVDGQTLELEGETDVSDDNAGVAFLDAPGSLDDDYLRWENVAKIEILH